jgi:hypothetical protein
LASEGDTVIIPAGSATWSNQLVLTKGISIIGNGIDSTVITSNYNAPSPNNVLTTTNYLIYYSPTTPANDTAFRISGMTIALENKCFGIMLKNTSYLYPQSKIRIDHIKTTNSGGTRNGPLMHIYGPVYGVSDHCEWGPGYMRCNSLDANAWTYLYFDFGTTYNFYWEDSTFSSPDTMFFYGEMGGRYCVRYNTFDGTSSTNGLYPFSDMHGNQTTSGHNASMGAELYENTITCNKGVCLLDQRGGKAVVYNNTITTTGSVSSKLREEYNDSTVPPANNIISGQPQHVSGSYYWNNLRNGTTLVTPYVSQTVDYGGSTGLVPQLDVDAWLEDAEFDGSSGLGVGLKSAMPSSGLAVGVGYWATDEKKLYRAKSSTEWELLYTPYTYPHPLAV